MPKQPRAWFLFIDAEHFLRGDRMSVIGLSLVHVPKETGMSKRWLINSLVSVPDAAAALLLLHSL